jgi:hypothetical protein
MWTNKEFVAFKIATASKFGPNFSIFFTAQPTDVSFESQFQTNKEFVVAFKIAADGKLGPNFFLFSTVQPTDVFFFGSQFHSSPSSKFVAFKIAANGKLFKFVHFCAIFRQIKNLLLPSKLPQIFSNVFFFGSQFQSRLVQNLLPSKLPRTIHSIQNFQCLRILNPTTLSFSLKFHLCRPIKNLLLPSKLPRTVNSDSNLFNFCLF